jgi:hypothetical protein
MRISGGNDKQGFLMRQGVLTNTRVSLLCKKGQKAYRQRRAGERKRKSVRGCIVGQDIAVLNLVMTNFTDKTIPGLHRRQLPTSSWTKACEQHPQALQLDEGRRCPKVRYPPYIHQQEGCFCSQAPRFSVL